MHVMGAAMKQLPPKTYLIPKVRPSMTCPPWAKPYMDAVHAAVLRMVAYESYQYEWKYEASFISRTIYHLHKHEYYPDLSYYKTFLSPPSPRLKLVGKK